MLHVKVNKRAPRVLDFDIECLAAGYADPAWVPDKITVVSWSWVGESDIRTVVTGKDGFFSRRLRGERLAPFREALRHADRVTGHNIVRFDLPVLQAEFLRCGIEPLGAIETHDTIRFTRTKGFKKSQDDMSVWLESPLKKKTLSWTEWDNAYEEEGWPVAIERCESDVRQHKLLYQRMLELNILKPVRMWRP